MNEYGHSTNTEEETAQALGDFFSSVNEDTVELDALLECPVKLMYSKQSC